MDSQRISPLTLSAEPGFTAVVPLTRLVVAYAVVRGILKVHQVVLGGSLELAQRLGEACAVLVHNDLHGAVVLLAQVVARLPEVRHGQPAGAHVTGATHSVALALQLHEALDRLRGAPVSRQPRPAGHTAKETQLRTVSNGTTKHASHYYTTPNVHFKMTEKVSYCIYKGEQEL